MSKILITTLVFLPHFASAEVLGGTAKILGAIKGIIGILIPIAFGLGVLFFFWGVAKYIWSAGGAKEEGKKIMLWGVVAIFVMSSIWGLVAFIEKNLGIDKKGNANIPTINGAGGGGGGGCAGEPGTADCP